MDSVRYALALLIIAGLPPAVAIWYAIHPFAAFWRRVGPFWTYAILAPLYLGFMTVVVVLRARILVFDFGQNWFLAGLGAVFLVAGGWITWARRRYLTMRILAGIPELSRDAPGQLLTEGIYGRIRHPRYVEVVLGVIGYALIANYLASYLVTALVIPGLALVIWMEERELRQRFGAEYDAYAERVPRFVPRRTSR